jgi:predicted site-specific integrase-resolvase
MMPDVTLGEAATAIGASLDTLRRWDDQGRIRTTRDAHNRMRVAARVKATDDRARPRRS